MTEGRWSLDGALGAEQAHNSGLRGSNVSWRVVLPAGEQQGISEWRALNGLVGPLIVPRQPHTNRQVRPPIYEQLRDWQAMVAKLRNRMENRRLSADAGLV
jgi:hypothetical protein